MIKRPVWHIFYLCIALAAPVCASTKPAQHTPDVAAAISLLQLPNWQVLTFEEKVFWATAKSKLEINPDLEDKSLWQMTVESSVLNNSEQINLVFNPENAQLLQRTRISRGKEQRMKSYVYAQDSVIRERRNASADPAVPPEKWPASSKKVVDFPAAAQNLVVTSPYLLILLAQRLQAQGAGLSLNVLVHTDLDFYRVRLSSGNGIPVAVKYQIKQGNTVTGKRETNGVAVQVQGKNSAPSDMDFNLLGLEQDIILLFERESGIPVQIRGIAPRIGATKINLRSVTMRQPKP